MAEKRRFLDIWIIESNTVYQEVPFEVVTDWLQQGRLLDDDKMKPSGTKDWQRIGDSPDFRPYSLAPQPNRPPDDKAEALEAVASDHVGGGHHRRHAEEEDDDIDMIPLIDVSLVLLIFFMLTATTVGASTLIDTPSTDHGQMVDDPSGLRIDIVYDDDGRTPLYTVAEGDKPAEEDDKEMRSLPALLDRLKAHLSRREGQTALTINAHKDLKARTARDLLLSLRGEPFRSKLSFNYFGVSEKE